MAKTKSRKKKGINGRGKVNRENYRLTGRFWTKEEGEHDALAVEEWVNRQNTWTPKMRHITKRIEYPKGYQEHQTNLRIIESNTKKINELETKARARTEEQQRKREVYIEELRAEINAITTDGEKYVSWEDTQIHRCIHGYRHMTGRQYFYYNFCWIEKVDENGRGMQPIQPDFRFSDNWLCRRIDAAYERKDGDLWAKRRRFGATWLAAGAIAIYDMIFNCGKVFFLTYDNQDTQKFFHRVMYIYERLPSFLKPVVKNDSMVIKRFAPCEPVMHFKGFDPANMPDAELEGGSPQDEKTVTGGTSTTIIVDEIGEIPNLRILLTWALPRLAGSDGFTRAGAIFLFGTVGSMDKAGPTVQWLVRNPEVNSHDVCLIKGTYGFKTDTKGNDMVDEALMEIQKKRTILEEAQAWEELVAFKQKYPIEWKDCWVYNTTQKLMPMRHIQISAEVMQTSDWHKKFKYGLFYRDSAGEVKFKREEPAPAGRRGDEYADQIGYNQWMILEDRTPSTWRWPYAAGCDPVDMQKDRFGTPRQKPKHGMYLSDITCAIYKRSQNVGELSDFWVAEYKGRPDDLEEAYEQILLGAEYYGAQVNYERQKGSAFLKYAEVTNRLDLIAMGSGVALRMTTNDRLAGFDASERWWDNVISHMRRWWIQNAGTKPVSSTFIFESQYVKEKNTDIFVSYAAAQHLANELDAREAAGQKRDKAVQRAAAQNSVRRTRQGRFINLRGGEHLSHAAKKELQRRRDRERKIGRR